jgi:hypothetical protein
MSIQAALLPLFVEVALTLGLLLWLGWLRRNDLNSGAVKPSQIALREPNWTTRTQQVTNCFANQFELPVLFYVLMILVIITHHADLFVLTRLMHAFVHATSNVVARRGGWYGFGAVALLAMWIILMVRVLAGAP